MYLLVSFVLIIRVTSKVGIRHATRADKADLNPRHSTHSSISPISYDFQTDDMKTAMILLCLVAAASAKPSRFFPVPHVGIATGFSDANSAQAQKSNIFGTTQVQQSAVNAGVSIPLPTGDVLIQYIGTTCRCLWGVSCLLPTSFTFCKYLSWACINRSALLSGFNDVCKVR